MLIVVALAVIGCAIGVIGVAARALSRRHRRRDSVGVFAAATTALEHIAKQPRPDVPAPEAGAPTPSVHVLPEVAALRLIGTRVSRTPAARRATYRPDAAVLARRPMVASLPTAPRQTVLADERLATEPSNADTRMPSGSVPQ